MTVWDLIVLPEIGCIGCIGQFGCSNHFKISAAFLVRAKACFLLVSVSRAQSAAAAPRSLKTSCSRGSGQS